MTPFPSAPSKRRTPPPLVFWIIWIAFLGSIGIYQFQLGGGLPHGANQGSQEWNLPLILAALQLSVATFIRWVILPKVTDRTKLLPLMVVGLALSEAVVFYGIFLIAPEMPHTKLEFFLAALCGTLQFAPFYAPPGGALREGLGRVQ